MCSILSLIVGLIVGYAAGKRAALAPVQAGSVKVIVAARDIPAGTRITQEMLVSIESPVNSVAKDTILNYSDVVGAYAKYYIPTGVVITHTMIAFPPGWK